MVSSNSSRRRPQIHGHRGCRGLFPENTIPAFLHALALGVDVLELDVVVSADQQVVVAHEPWLAAHLGLSPTGQPITPSQEQAFNIYQLPYATIRQSVVGTLPHPGFPMQQLVATYRPLLSEVLAATEAACQQMGREPVGYSIELKSSPDTDTSFHPVPAVLVAQVLHAISAAVLPRVTLLSFDSRVLQVAHQQYPRVATCYLVEEPFMPALVFRQLGFVPTTFGPDVTMLTLPHVQELRILYPALALVPWTVNERVVMERLLAWGVEGITTDYPDQLLNIVT